MEASSDLALLEVPARAMSCKLQPTWPRPTGFRFSRTLHHSASLNRTWSRRRNFIARCRNEKRAPDCSGAPEFIAEVLLRLDRPALLHRGLAGIRRATFFLLHAGEGDFPD